MPILLFTLTIGFMMCLGGMIQGIHDGESIIFSVVLGAIGGFLLACAMVLAATIGYEAAL